MTILLEDIKRKESMIQSAVFSSNETTFVNNNFKDELSAVDIEVDGLATKLEQDGALGRFMMSVGLCNCKAGHCLDDASISMAPTEAMTDDSDVEVDNLDDFDASDFDSEEMLEEHFTSSAFVMSEVRIDSKHLSKVWKIGRKASDRTTHVTAQICVRGEDLSVRREHNTNDRTLRYDRLYNHFFMDTFFATKKATKYTRGNTCCQIFATH